MTLDSVHPAWLVVALFILAALSPGIGRLPSAVSRIAWVAAMLANFLYFAIVSWHHWDSPPSYFSVPWADDLGINWDIWLAPTGLLMAGLVTGIGTLVALFGHAYLEGDPKRARFFAYFFLFAGAMLGLTVTENLLVFFVFWELTSISSYLLIGYYHSKLESRKSALDALLITGSGGVILLAGVIMIGEVGGTYRISELVENRELIVSHPLYAAIFACFFLGAITKSAQFPFHFWLPGAMAAPAPVSSYLHSATMVKAGVFLFAIMHPVLGETPLWHNTLIVTGALTMTLGAVVAIAQTDLKRLLAFTTVSALGTLVMLLGIENTLAAKTVVVFLVVHALYKGALFMVAGIIEKTTGTREIDQLRGLMRTMPALGIAAVFAAASMSGLPPFIGFISKELLYAVKLETPIIGWGLLLCGIVTNAASIVVAIKVGVTPFLGSADNATPLKKKPPVFLWLSPLILSIGSLVLGVFPNTLLGSAVDSVASQIKMEPVSIKLKLWHGFNLVLLLSALTVALGITGYFFSHHFRRWAEVLRERIGWNFQILFRSGFDAFLAGAGKTTRFFQSGNLKQYFATILASAVILILLAFRDSGFKIEIPDIPEFRIDVALALIVTALAAIGSALARQRMAAVLLLGCAGFGIAGIFALYGAPDLAITQLLVETLTLVLFALAIYGLPRVETKRTSKAKTIRSLILPVAIGIVFTLLTLKAFSINIHEPVARDIAQLSVPEGFGRNVVNVILVDFRALDTLGEVSVLVIAALGVAAMLRDSNASKRDSLSPTRQNSAVLLASARYTTPAMLVFSVYLLLRGHNEPGGGFIGGLIAAMAIILTHLAKPNYALNFLWLSPINLSAIGLLLAAFSGLPGLRMSDSFLAAEWGPSFYLPAVGKIKVGSPLFFDIGVYMVVAGVVLMLYQALENWHASRNEPEPEEPMEG